MGNIGDTGQIGLDVKIGAVGEGLLGGDGEVGVVGAHHPAVLEGEGVGVAGLKVEFLIGQKC